MRPSDGTGVRRWTRRPADRAGCGGSIPPHPALGGSLHRRFGSPRTGLTSMTGVPSIASRLRTVTAFSSTARSSRRAARSGSGGRATGSRTPPRGACSRRRAGARRARRGDPGAARSARVPRRPRAGHRRPRETRVGRRSGPGAPPRHPVSGLRPCRPAAIPPGQRAAAGKPDRSSRRPSCAAAHLWSSIEILAATSFVTNLSGKPG